MCPTLCKSWRELILGKKKKKKKEKHSYKGYELGVFPNTHGYNRGKWWWKNRALSNVCRNQSLGLEKI